MNYKGVADHITEWLKNYVETNPIEGFVMGISGGIDSSVTSALCARTGLPLLLIEMPIHQNQDQVTTGKKHINFLKENFDNVRSIEVDLTSTFDNMKNSLSETSDFSGEDLEKEGLALANLRSRLRMTTLYSFATMNNSIVCGTGNKVEDFGVFFYTKYGDGGVDVSPIADLMKSEVYDLGSELGLIDEVLNAVPTDGLWEGSPTDEDQIGASYDELEWAMSVLDDNLEYNANSYVELNDRELEVIEIYKSKHRAGLHKSLEIPICKIPNELR